MASDRKAFETAMVAAGYDKPERATHPDSGYLYQRDEDRFVGWSLASHTGEAEPVDPEQFLDKGLADVQDEGGLLTYYSKGAVLECIAAALAAPGAAIAAREQETDILQFAPKFSGVSGPEPTLERIIWRYYLGHIDNEQEAHNYAAAYVDALRTVLASRKEPRVTPPAATPAAPGERALSHEHEIALREGHQIRACEDYFSARPKGFETINTITAYEAGFKKGWEDRAALSHPAPVAAPASVPQAIEQLVSALAESKGWMRDYARALIEDAIDRRHLEVAAPAPASEAVALTDEQISAARLRVRPCPVPGVTFQWLCEFARALPIPTPGDSADAPVQQATKTEREAFEAWFWLEPECKGDCWEAWQARAALKGEQPAQPSGSERGEV